MEERQCSRVHNVQLASDLWARCGCGHRLLRSQEKMRAEGPRQQESLESSLGQGGRSLGPHFCASLCASGCWRSGASSSEEYNLCIQTVPPFFFSSLPPFLPLSLPSFLLFFLPSLFSSFLPSFPPSLSSFLLLQSFSPMFLPPSLPLSFLILIKLIWIP